MFLRGREHALDLRIEFVAGLFRFLQHLVFLLGSGRTLQEQLRLLQFGLSILENRTKQRFLLGSQLELAG